jgi:hypothetical protein
MTDSPIRWYFANRYQTCPADITRDGWHAHSRDNDPHVPRRAAKPSTIKVRVAFTVTIDVDAYRAAYGSDDVATIRYDVKAAIRDAVATGGVLADGIVDVS